jgi:hypothetical protein
MGKKGNAEVWLINMTKREYFVDGRIRLKWTLNK